VTKTPQTIDPAALRNLIAAAKAIVFACEIGRIGCGNEFEDPEKKGNPQCPQSMTAESTSARSNQQTGGFIAFDADGRRIGVFQARIAAARACLENESNPPPKDCGSYRGRNIHDHK